jgi:WD40 repeat protein
MAAPTPEVDGYDILAELGRGGMGVVYKARQRGLNRIVALKMIGLGTAANPDLLARFKKEAEVIARLQQPNIIQVYDIGSSPSGPYFAMEYAEGGSLAERWAGTPQPARVAARTIASLATAVQAAHEQGIIHRDLKPANILLAYVSGSQSPDKNSKRFAGESERRTDRELLPKISDFGLARHLDDPRSLTLTGQVMGTPGYMAPEQARGRADDVGPAADIYALGVLLYEALTGNPPYRGVSALESVHLMLSEEPLAPSRLRPGLPRDLETICLHCLNKEANKRYATAGELAADLERFLAGEPIKARPTSLGERVWKWSRRHPGTAGLSVALVLSVVLGFVLVLKEWRRAQSERDLANDARREAVELAAAEQRSRHEAQVLSANLMLERGAALCEAGECGPGLLWLARVLEAAPDDDVQLKRSARMVMGGWRRQLRLPRAVFPLGDEVECAALTRDGSTLAAAAGIMVQLWKTDARQPYVPPLVHGGPVDALCFALEDSALVTGSKDGCVRIWNVRNGTPKCEPLRHESPIVAVTASPDGKLIMSASEDGYVRLWDCSTGRPICEPLVHRGSICAVAFSADGKLIATSNRFDAVRLWDATTGRHLQLLSHGGVVDALAFSPNGTMLATGCTDKIARVWSIPSGRLIRELTEHTGEIRSIAFSPDSRTIATGSGDRKAILWDVTNGAVRARLEHRECVRRLVFSPGGKAVATTSGDTVRLWAADNGRPLGAPLPHHADVNAFSFGPTGELLLTASDDGMVRLWPTEPPGVAAAFIPTGTRIRQLAVSPDGQNVLTCDEGGVTLLWDLKSRTHRSVAIGARTAALAFSPDGRTFLTAGWDRTVAFWDAASGAPAGQPLEHTSKVFTASYSPDGKYVVTGTDDDDAKVRVWDITTGAVVATMAGHQRRVVSAAFSPDGNSVISGSWDKTARLWRVADGTPIGDPLMHQDLVQTVAFSPDGNAVLTGGDDFTARLWDPVTTSPLGPPLRHGEKIIDARISPNGSVVLTVGTGGTARLWERASGKLLSPALPYRGGLMSGAFAPDGRTFFTGGQEGIVRSWTVPSSLEGEPSAVWQWLHAYTGLQLDPAGAIVPLAPKSWYEAYIAARNAK